jgi:MoxR-like ATPase
MEYMVKLTRRTRQHAEAYLGASPRGSLALYRAGQTRAAILGRDYVLPDDIKVVALPALAHRVIPGPAARLRDVTADRIVEGVVEKVPVPGGDFGEE